MEEEIKPESVSEEEPASNHDDATGSKINAVAVMDKPDEFVDLSIGIEAKIENKPKKSFFSLILKIGSLFFILILLAIPIVILIHNSGKKGNETDLGESVVSGELKIEDPITTPEYSENLVHGTSDFDFIEQAPTVLPDEIISVESAQSTETEKTEPAQEKITQTGLNGYYTQVYYNGDTYTGNFVNNVRSGQGTYTWANGVVYTGGWENGVPNGDGDYVYPTEPPTEPPPTTIPPATLPPDPTEPPPATVPPPTAPPATMAPERYIEAPKADFMRIMFENAIEIPDSENKIEPPPAGRSIELQYGIVPLSDVVPEPYGYFKDIIFLGDSVTIGFDLFKKSVKFNGEPVLRDATVIAVGSYGVYKSTEAISASSIHPMFNGKQTLPEDIIAQKNGKYVLICLGLNDVSWVSADKLIEYYSSLINRINAKNPDKTAVIMSVTPLVYGGQKNNLNNKNIMDKNNALLQFAKENNIPFIDYGAAIRDSQNHLYDELSSDAYCHLTIPAYNRLVEYLLYHPLTD